MKDSTIVKLTAIVCLTLLGIVNALVWKVDKTFLLSLGAIIGGIAGYEVRDLWERLKRS